MTPSHPLHDELPADLLEAMGTLQAMGDALLPPDLQGLLTLTWSDPVEHEDVPQSIEERLRTAEMRFRTLVEQIPAVVFMAVLGEGKNDIYVSPHVEQMLGFTQTEWLENPFLWYWQLHPDDRVRWNQEFERGVKTGGPFRAECRFMAKDGHTVWVHGEARLVKDERGRPQLLQGVAFDITDAKRAQEMLLNEAVRSAKVEQDLATARRVQTSVVPRAPKVKGLQFAAAMQPADDVGGDYYDVREFPWGAWISIGDVAGHGLDAGLIMLMVHSAFTALTDADPHCTPKKLLCNLNAGLYDSIRKRLVRDDHVTMSVLRYTVDGRFVFAGAHEDLLVWSARTGEVTPYRTPGTWVGARRDIESVTVDTDLHVEDGDVIVLYTDGVTEAMSPTGELWNLDRLMDAVKESAPRGPDAVKDHVMARVRGWMHKQFDDITIVVLRYTAPA